MSDGHIIEKVKGLKYQVDKTKEILVEIHVEIQNKQDEIQDLECEIEDLQDDIHRLEEAEEDQELVLENIELEIKKLLTLEKDNYSESQISELLYGPDTQTLRLFPDEDLEESLI